MWTFSCHQRAISDYEMTFDPLALLDQEASRFLCQFEHVLHQACADTIQLISDVQLVSPNAMTQLQTWKDLYPVSCTATIPELDLSQASNDQGQTDVDTAFDHNPDTGEIYPMDGYTNRVTVPSDPSRLAPLGAVGELLIEGPDMTLNHLNGLCQMPVASIEPPKWLGRFHAPGLPGKVYRSRDLVKVTGGGSIKLFGHKYTHKHHGRWIDLSKVEHDFQRHLATRQEVIADVVHIKGQKEHQSTALVAFVQCVEGDQALDTNYDQNGDGGRFLDPSHNLQLPSEALIVQARLRASFPSFMIPDAFVLVRRMPLTPAGVIDRIALHEATSALDIPEYIPRSPRNPPITEDERQILCLVVEVLGLSSDKIGILDNSFDLGGDSIESMLLSTKSRISGRPITVGDIYKYQSL